MITEIIMDRTVAIDIDGASKNVVIIPEHWNYGQSGFENADVYLVVDESNEKSLATICFTEDKSHWEASGELDIEAENEVASFIKSQSPLTAE